MCNYNVDGYVLYTILTHWEYIEILGRAVTPTSTIVKMITCMCWRLRVYRFCDCKLEMLASSGIDNNVLFGSFSRCSTSAKKYVLRI